VVVALVAENVFPDSTGRSKPSKVAHVIVGSANQVACIPLLDELGYRARGGEGDVVGMRLNRRQNLALVRCAHCRLLDEDVVGRGPLCCRCSKPHDSRPSEQAGEKVSSLHSGSLNIGSAVRQFGSTAVVRRGKARLPTATATGTQRRSETEEHAGEQPQNAKQYQR